MRKSLEPSKKNEWSIPRTVSCLSNITSLKNLDTANDLIKNHKRVGNVFINLTADKGLSLYSSIPGKFRHRFITIFKNHPKAIIGITKTHLIIHTLKVLDKYGLTALIMPFIGISLILSLIPAWALWVIFIGSSGYLVFSTVHKLKQ